MSEPEQGASRMRSLWQYFLRDEMPIWLSILFAILTGGGAYLLAPLINQQFEYENNKVEHVSKTVDSMNQLIIDLSKSARRFNDDLFYGRSNLKNSRNDALDRVTELQWRLIDASTIIGREGGNAQSVKILQKDLKRLADAIRNASVPEDQENVVQAMQSCSASSEVVLRDLYKAARLTT